MRVRGLCPAAVILCVLAVVPLSATAQTIGTAFTFQGRLTDGGSPANGEYDFNFSLFDAPTLGRQVGATLSPEQVPVIQGHFTVPLDFGDNFRGDALWLEIEVAPYRSGTYTVLLPRQELTPTPYAVYAATAETALGGITGSGSANRVPKFTGSRTLGNSAIYDDGTKVGINTTTPGFVLDVGDLAESYNHLRIGATNYTSLMFYDGEGTCSGQVYYDHTGDFMKFTTRSGTSLSERMRITSDGRVGIGTGGPDEKLSVKGVVESTTGGFKFPDGTIQTTAGGGTSTWQQSGSDIYYMGGNVGIGTITPAYELDLGDPAEAFTQLRISSATSGGIMFYDGEGVYSGQVRYDHTEDYLQFATRPPGSGPYERMRLDTSGFLGIGTTSPGYRLDLGNSSDGSNWLRISATQTTGILFHDDESLFSGAINYENNGDYFAFHVRQPGGGVPERMRLDTNGYLGIGTLPSYRLDIGDSGDPANALRIGGTDSTSILFYDGEGSYSGAIAYDHTSDHLWFQTRGASGSAEVMRLTTDGKMGLGNNSPAYKLELGNVSENYNYMRIDAASYCGLLFYDGESSYSGMIRYDHTGDFMEFHTRTSSGTKEVMRLTTEGYLGLGKANPTARLHIQPPVLYPAIRITDSAGAGDTVTIAGNGVTELDVDSFQSALQVANSGSGDSIQASNASGVVFRVANDGITHVNILAVEGGSDLAEQFDVGSDAKPGMVVEIDPAQAGRLRVAQGAYSRLVAGVISGAGGVDAGMILADLPGNNDSQPVALTGRVWVYCDATQRPINPGDLMTTADRPGHAMAVVDHDRAQGAVLGKAMTPLEEGSGLVLVLVTLQ